MKKRSMQCDKSPSVCRTHQFITRHCQKHVHIITYVHSYYTL